jgi:hypothetical protein
MTTILLVWYALGWTLIGLTAIDSSKLYLLEAVVCMITAPFFPIYLLLKLIEKSDDSVILWRRK